MLIAPYPVIGFSRVHFSIKFFCSFSIYRVKTQKSQTRTDNRLLQNILPGPWLFPVAEKVSHTELCGSRSSSHGSPCLNYRTMETNNEAKIPNHHTLRMLNIFSAIVIFLWIRPAETRFLPGESITIPCSAGGTTGYNKSGTDSYRGGL